MLKIRYMNNTVYAISSLESLGSVDQIVLMKNATRTIRGKPSSPNCLVTFKNKTQEMTFVMSDIEEECPALLQK